MAVIRIQLMNEHGVRLPLWDDEGVISDGGQLVTYRHQPDARGRAGGPPDVVVRRLGGRGFVVVCVGTGQPGW